MDLTSLITQLVGGLDLSQINNLDMAKFLFAVLSLQTGLRISAELLTKLSVATDSKWEGPVAKALSQASWSLGAFLGLFGLGTPGAVIDDHKDQAVQAAAPAPKPEDPAAQ